MKLKRTLFIAAILCLSFEPEALFALTPNDPPKSIEIQSETITIKLEPGEKIWAGVINEGNKMPLKPGYNADFNGNNYGNQVQPLILTNKGQYVWSEEPFRFDIKDNMLVITKAHGTIEKGKEGSTLAQVQNFVRNKFFPSAGKSPDQLLFSSPQYNTWIELLYNQNQEDILKYAKAIIDNGFPPGVLMIDDTWQEDYGKWNFHPGRFPDPKKMIDELHRMGFKVMVWICPFVSADQALITREIQKTKGFLLHRIDEKSTWENSSDPILIKWWNGSSAELDFTNPGAVNWFNRQLDLLMIDYGVDGFKFDAGDMEYYPENSLSKTGVSSNEHCRLFAEIGLRFPLNEYRACWKMAGQPLVQRLRDKNHTWEDLQALVPNMLVQNLVGYTFSCPDMIGGGDYSSFTDHSGLDQDLIVRSAQCHALMTMMQFSVAPWRILDQTHLEAVKRAVEIRTKFTPLIMKLTEKSAVTGEPIMKMMELVFPGKDYASITDQFMLGDQMLVAPMMTKGKQRSVVLPKGKWIADDGTSYEGGKTYVIEVPINRLPFFRFE